MFPGVSKHGRWLPGFHLQRGSETWVPSRALRERLDRQCFSFAGREVNLDRGGLTVWEQCARESQCTRPTPRNFPLIAEGPPVAMNRVHRQRRRNALIVLAVAFLLSLVPHPKEGDGLPSVQEHAITHASDDVIEAENTCISVMLLGCMGFMMAMFYLVNWPDEDIRRISWEVMSATISVFGSLLLFQGFNRVLEHYFFRDFSIWQQLGVAMLQLLVWFAMLQLVLGYQSGAVGENRKVSQRRAALESAEMSSSPSERLQHFRLAEQLMHDIQLDTHAAAVLMGHVTGFAAVNAWGVLQQAVPRTFWCCAAIPPLSFCGISWVYQATRYVRHKKTFADGEEDEYEVVWGEHVAETEDEVISLSVSFLAVQMFRFCISGHLPDANGMDKAGQEWHSNFQCALLLLIGVIAGSSDVARLLHERSRNVNFTRVVSSDSKSSKVSTSPVSSARTGGWFQKISAMTFAFSLLFAAEWWISSSFDLEGSLKAVVSALLVTCVAFVFIFGIDKVADMHFEDAELDQALRLIISALGMLIGFSWERCFDAALGGLSSGVDDQGANGSTISRHHLGLGSLPPPVCNLLMAVALAVLVLPAWKWYILPSLHSHGCHSASATGSVEDAEEPPEDLGNETRLFGRFQQGCEGGEEVKSTSWCEKQLLFKEKRGLSSSSLRTEMSLASVASVDRYTPRMISI
eukprot:s419_g3.t1